MKERWVGIVPSSKKVTLVHLEYEVFDDIVVNDDTKWDLPTGDEPQAYLTLFNQMSDYLKQNNVKHVVVKGSTPSPSGGRMAHLKTAEVRGVIIAACAKSNAQVHILTKSTISRNFGKRKFKEYIEDDNFWDERIDPETIRKGSREAIFLIFAVRKDLKDV